MDHAMHEAPPTYLQSAETAEHIPADHKQFKLYSYTGNIADYDDDEIFSSLELDKAHDLVSWILDHPFLQSRSGKGSKRQRFDAEIRDKAILAGMDAPTTDALLVYVDKLYAERRKRFSRKKQTMRHEGTEQGSQNISDDLNKEEKSEERADTESVDCGPMETEDLLTETPSPSATSQLRKGVINKARDGLVECLSARHILPQKGPLASTSGNQNEDSLASKAKEQLASRPCDENGTGIGAMLSLKAKAKNHRKRAARKARRAERRASYRATHTTSPKESPAMAGPNHPSEAPEMDRSDLGISHNLDDAPRHAEDMTVADGSGF